MQYQFLLHSEKWYCTRQKRLVQYHFSECNTKLILHSPRCRVFIIVYNGDLLYSQHTITGIDPSALFMGISLWLAIVCAVPYYARPAHAFSAGITHRHCGTRPLLTLLMLRLLLSKAHECKDFWKPSKPCYVGIHWKALVEYSQMSAHVPGSQSFLSGFLLILYWSN